MRLKYVYIDRNNGHSITYQPFTANQILTQEQITEWLMAIPGATRTGTKLGHLLQILDDKLIDWEPYQCLCCGQMVREFTKEAYEDWVDKDYTVLEGIEGNY